MKSFGPYSELNSSRITSLRKNRERGPQPQPRSNVGAHAAPRTPSHKNRLVALLRPHHDLSWLKKQTAPDLPALSREANQIWRVGLARTRPLSEPLSPRGPQPVIDNLREVRVWLNGPEASKISVP